MKKKLNLHSKQIPTKDLEQAILKTLTYRAIFNYPMTLYQLCYFLNTKEDKTLKIEKVKNTLEKLQEKGLVRTTNNKFTLNYVKTVNVEKRAERAEKLLRETNTIKLYLQKIPWIKFVGITGSVAAFNVTEENDIDIFIITQKNRAWITRLCVVFILKILDKYPKENCIAEKICPNLIVDEDHMGWNKDSRNLFVANEIIMMIPILSRDNTYFKFLQENLWIKTFFGNFNVSTNKKSRKSINSSIVDVLENNLMNMQLKYMKDKKTNEVTKKGFIHFNKNDSKPVVLDRYVELLHKININF